MLKEIENLLKFKSNLLKQKYNNELLMAAIFDSSINGVDWIKSKSFSPSRAAANYSFLYILFRVLDDICPKSIIEFGMGQTSKLTSQYVFNKNQDAKLTIIEHNKIWIDIFKSKLSLNSNIKIENLETSVENYKSHKVIIYKNLQDIIKYTKYDLMIIDGIGAEKYSRIYVLDLIPNNINKDSFVIILDDYDRDGERNTAKEIIMKLKNNNIPFERTEFSGVKSQLIFCSPNLKFLQTI